MAVMRAHAWQCGAWRTTG